LIFGNRAATGLPRGGIPRTDNEENPQGQRLLADLRAKSTDCSVQPPRIGEPPLANPLKGILSVFDDVASVALRSALDGLSARQRAIADNIANVETPGYQARKVQFEEALHQAVAAGRPATAQATESRSLEPTRLNGSNVNLDQEMLSNIDTNLRYQLALRALDGKYSSIRTVIGS
jgi:flagellar basal-body rod protein FlgB